MWTTKQAVWKSFIHKCFHIPSKTSLIYWHAFCFWQKNQEINDTCSDEMFWCFLKFWNMHYGLFSFHECIRRKKYRLSNAILSLINNSNVNSLTWTFVQIAFAVWRIFAQKKESKKLFHIIKIDSIPLQERETFWTPLKNILG